MKCPKCGYLGFEDADRCRNCGYEFLLAEGTAAAPELSIRIAPPAVDPLADLAMVDAAVAPASVRASAPTPSELPLFRFPAFDDEDVSRTIDPPRPRSAGPERNRGAVQRPAPETPRRRVDEVRPYSLDLGLEMPAALDTRAVAEPGWSAAGVSDAAPLAARVLAVVIDLAIVAAIDAAVVYFTLQICGITFADLDLLPKGPLVAFLLVQNGGYLIAFTAEGQTLGKMLTGIRVVGAGGESPLDFGRAALRTAVWLLLAVPGGLGFVSALFRSDHRGLHDRFAQTRVVRG